MRAQGTLRVMTWNIHGGIGPDGRHDLARMLTLVRRCDPDVLALQEVDARKVRGGEHPIDLFERVLGHRGIRAAAITTVDGDYGQVLMSRWPMHQSKVHDISVPGREPRRAIATIVTMPSGGRFYVVAAHLGLKFTERRRQCNQMAAIIEETDLPVILLGDLNDWMWPGSVQNVLARHLPGRTHHRTFPSRFPVLRLDRIYCRPETALINSWTEPGGAAVSDHLPVIADIALPGTGERRDQPSERARERDPGQSR